MLLDDVIRRRHIPELSTADDEYRAVVVNIRSPPPVPESCQGIHTAARGRHVTPAVRPRLTLTGALVAVLLGGAAAKEMVGGGRRGLVLEWIRDRVGPSLSDTRFAADTRNMPAASDHAARAAARLRG